MDVFEQGLFYRESDGAFASADASDNELINEAFSKFELSDNISSLDSNIIQMQSLISSYKTTIQKLKTPAPPFFKTVSTSALQSAKRYEQAIDYLTDLIKDHKTYKENLLKNLASKAQISPIGSGTGSGTTSGGAGGGVGSGGTGGGVGSVTSGSGVGSGLGGLGLGSGLTDAGTTDDKKDSNKKLLIYGGIGVGVLLLVVLLVRRNG